LIEHYASLTNNFLALANCQSKGIALYCEYSIDCYKIRQKLCHAITTEVKVTFTKTDPAFKVSTRRNGEPVQIPEKYLDFYYLYTNILANKIQGISLLYQDS